MKDAFLRPWVIVISLLLSEPLAGFTCGVIICTDCGANPIKYIAMGAIHSVISTILLGHCWSDTSSSTNLWPYTPLSALALWLTIGTIRLAVARKE